MNKIKETITALTNPENTTAVRVSRKENMPLSEECFKLALKCINRTVLLVIVATVVINIDIWKLIALIVLIIIYFMFKD